MNTKKIFGIFLLMVSGYLVCSQEAVRPLTQQEKTEVIDSISSILLSDYIFEDTAKKMSGLLKEKLEAGAFEDIADPNELADILTGDLQAVSKDKHLRIDFAPEMINDWRNASISEEDSIDMVNSQLRNNRRNNYGFKEVKILDGNIGYLNLAGFFHVDEEAGETARAAMNFLSNADALIIDLRQNGGGSPSMIQLITSYLYGPERVHLNNFYHRPADEHTQTWTLPYVPGKRRPDMDVYVLTSSRTFSAAEEFSYNLRNLERATLVGEVTGGGAHPGGTRIATDRYTIWVPTGRAINPITNTNWEGVGVTPHIEVAASEAFEVAQIFALEKLIERADSADKYSLQWALDGLKAKNNPVILSKNTLMAYTGKFGPRNIKMKDGNLYYQREGNPEYLLVPIDDDLFMIEEIPYFRIKFIKEKGIVTAILGMYDNGRTDKSLKTNSQP